MVKKSTFRRSTFNVAGVVLDKLAARFDFGAHPEVFVGTGIVPPVGNADVVKVTLNFADFASTSDVQWTFYLYGQSGTAPGLRFDDILVGLNPGEWVALEGVLRLKADMKVVPKLARLDDSGAPQDVDVAARPDA